MSTPFLRFDGRTAIVTGAGRGIGRAHAHLLAERGAGVVVADLDAEPAEAVAAEISALGGRAVAVTTDISTASGADALVAAALEAFGGVDVIVNNAGTITQGTIESATLDDLQRFFDVHGRGSFLLARAAWTHLKASGTGRIINTVSPSMLGTEGLIAYGTSKGAVFALTRNLAMEGASHGIRCSAISPGAATRMLEATAGSIPQETIDWMRTAVTAEQVAPLVAYLAHPSSQDINGELFFVAGGAVARQAIVQAPGFADPGHTVEDIAENIDRIMDLSGAVPQVLAVPAVQGGRS